ncbi:hypothetical protein N9043_00885 [bacterium]|nr:hypothetical protein [bacterium]
MKIRREIEMLFKPHKDLYEFFTKDERERWANYLRETDLKQCNATMSDGQDTACCLMVWEVYERNNGEWFNPIGTYDDETEIAGLPSNMMENTILKSGVLPESVNIASSDELDSITPAVLNDHHGFTFSEIADILEGKEVIKS